MQKINLRKLYPLYYKTDYYVEVSDEVAEQIMKAERAEHAYRERTRVHKAYYSLDVGNGIEKDILFVQMSPQEIYERKVSNAKIYAAISALPEKQAKRIYAYFFQDMSVCDIAKVERVSHAAINHSISRALIHIAETLKNFWKGGYEIPVLLLTIERDYFS